ncbi:AtpZ/AtpI family protein [bacterium]|nr:AtpZ/AtpI family protein [bacterium]
MRLPHGNPASTLDKEPNDQQENQSFYKAFAIYGAVGFQLVLSIVAGLWLGGLADTHFNTKPWIAIAGIVTGAVVGFYNLVRLLNRYSNNE